MQITSNPARAALTVGALSALVIAIAACAGGKTVGRDDGQIPLPDSRTPDGPRRDTTPRDGPPRDGPPRDGPLLVDITVDATRDTLATDSTVDATRDTLAPDTTRDGTIDTGGGGEICTGGVDDDADGYIDCADPDCYAKSPCVAASRTLVVQEVFPGQPDYIVIRNASTSVRNIAGYTLEFRGTGTVNYTLPSRTLAPGQTVHVFELSDGLSGDIQSGVNIPFYDALPTFANAFILRNPAGTVIDYGGFGDSLAGLPTGMSQVGGAVTYTGFNASTDSHFRSGMAGSPPTFRATDWKRAKSTR